MLQDSPTFCNPTMKYKETLYHGRSGIGRGSIIPASEIGFNLPFLWFLAPGFLLGWVLEKIPIDWVAYPLHYLSRRPRRESRATFPSVFCPEIESSLSLQNWTTFCHFTTFLLLSWWTLEKKARAITAETIDDYMPSSFPCLPDVDSKPGLTQEVNTFGTFTISLPVRQREGPYRTGKPLPLALKELLPDSRKE